MKSLHVTLIVIWFSILSVSCTHGDNELANREMIDVRKNIAVEAIKQAYGKESQEYGVTLFVNHHLEELEENYWKSHLDTSNPSPSQVLDALVLMDKWESEGEEIYDFTLPGNITQYVISVSFNGNGDVLEIVMES